MESLDGKVAIVTGASKGIGREIARQLAAEGVIVVAAARSEDALGGLVHGAERAGGRLVARAVDLRDSAQCTELVASTAREFAHVDILVNNAGLAHWSPVESMTDEQWRETMDVNVDAVFYLCREAVKQMRRAGGGRIVNIASVAGRRGSPGMAAYGASKAAVINFSEGLAQEVKGSGITVSIVSPGTADTRFRAIHPSEGRTMTPALTEPERMLTASAVASAVVWTLKSDPSVILMHTILEPTG